MVIRSLPAPCPKAPIPRCAALRHVAIPKSVRMNPFTHPPLPILLVALSISSAGAADTPKASWTPLYVLRNLTEYTPKTR